MKISYIPLLAILHVSAATAADPAWHELIEKGRAQSGAGSFQDAERTFRSALGVAKREGLGPESLAVTLNDLGYAQLTLGDLVAAESSLKRALAAWESVTGNQVGRTATMTNLGIVYRLTGRLTQAEATQRQALSARLAALGPDHPAVAKARDYLAAVLFDLRQYREAIELLKKADARYAVAPPADPLDHAIVKGKLAAAYYLEGDLTNANQAVREVLSMLEGTPNGNHPVAGETLLVAADIYIGEGEYRAAGDVLGRAMKILEAAYASGHPSLAHALTSYARLLRHEGNKREAKRFEKKAEAMLVEHSRQNLFPYTVDYRELGKPAR